MAVNWEKVDSWRIRHTTFLVEVKHYTEPQRDSSYLSDSRRGIHRWNVHVYIYPEHPRFKMFDGTSLWQEATSDLPLHGGCSYLKYHYDEGRICSVQIGADYNHDGDSHYTYDDADDNAYFLRDGEKIFEFLAREAANV